jgi:hypothetical protein
VENELQVFNCIRENTSSAIQTNDAKVEKIKNWESEKKGEFISNINIEDINELALLLNNLSEQDSGLVDFFYVFEYNDPSLFYIFSLKILSVQVGARYG